MNILVDGPARSGKLLLGKLLLGSPQFKFQHFSGDIETLLEAIYFNRTNTTVEPILLELFRNNLVHTLEDLRQFRQLSINPNDSSWYKNSVFFNEFSEQIQHGNITGLMGENPQFIFHSHECVLFLDSISTNKQLSKYFKSNLGTIVSIIRNPASQALSWISRGYPKTWSRSNCHESPSILYPPSYILPSLLRSDIEGVPWFINDSLGYYVNNGSLDVSCIESFTVEELLVLSVCYLTYLYLESASHSLPRTNEAFLLNRFHLYHEDLHDKRAKSVELILNKMGMDYCSKTFHGLVDMETDSVRFGRKSVQSSLDRLAVLFANSPVLPIMENASADYLAKLN